MNNETLWNTRYLNAGEDYLFGTSPSTFLARRTGLFSQGETAFLVADGEGRNSVWLAEHGVHATAIDIAPVAVEKARRLAARIGVCVELVVGDMLAPAWPPVEIQEKFDWVVGIFIQFVAGAERARQFEVMKQLTRSSGHILLHGYTEKQLEFATGGPSTIENLYTKELLLAAFAGWKVEELIEYEEDLSEGSRHKGRSALIGLLVKKP